MASVTAAFLFADSWFHRDVSELSGGQKQLLNLAAIVMITGIALGPEAGFLTGAFSAFASNFFFSQGPWTPWQMLAYGIGGFLAGLVFGKRPKFRDPRLLAVFGFVLVMTVVGPILDLCSLFTTATRFSWATALP